MMMVGKRHQREHETADEGGGARHTDEVDEDRETEEAEHDRRNGRQVVDVDLDDVGHEVLRRELLEVNRGGHTPSGTASTSTVSIMNNEPMSATPMPAVSGWLDAP